MRVVPLLALSGILLMEFPQQDAVSRVDLLNLAMGIEVLGKGTDDGLKGVGLFGPSRALRPPRGRG